MRRTLLIALLFAAALPFASISAQTPPAGGTKSPASNEAPKGEAPKGETPKGEAPKGDTAKEEPKKADAPKPEAPKPPTIEDLRKDRSKYTNAQLLAVDLSPIADIKLDQPYVEGEGAHERHKLDIYMPKGKKDVPVVVFFHGGAWISFDKTLGRAVALSFLEAGYGVVSAGYRLSPGRGKKVEAKDDVKFPSHAEDAAKAFAWVHKNISKHGGDPKRLFVSGHSAGGHLAACIACDPAYLEAHKIKASEAIRGVVAISGVYLIPHATDEQYGFFAPMFDSVFPTEEEARAKASPINAMDSSDPAMLFLYGAQELPTLDLQANLAHAKMTEAQVASTLQKCEGRTHETILKNFGIEGDAAAKAALAFIKERLEAKDHKAVVKADPSKPVTGEGKAETPKDEKKPAAEVPAPAGK